MSTRNSLSAILEQNKLTGPNYQDWLRNIKIVLNSERIAYVLEKKPPKEAAPNISETELAKLEKWWDHDLQAKSYILASMSNELQRRFEDAANAADIHFHLKELYGVQTRSERHATVKELMTTRLREGASVHEHGVRMIGTKKGAQNKGKKRSAPAVKNKPNKKPYKKPAQGPKRPNKSEQVCFH
ncbi:uncharacterized protein [Henckelia pumila]|uniref:uncharacterized protein n=1 Tax=Henckelia pumila TaxID=405737 RepID=UPI003C6E627B